MQCAYAISVLVCECPPINSDHLSQLQHGNECLNSVSPQVFALLAAEFTLPRGRKKNMKALLFRVWRYRGVYEVYSQFTPHLATPDGLISCWYARSEP